MKHSSVFTYYQAVIFAHKSLGLEAPPASHPLLKSIFLGQLNAPGRAPVPKDPLRPADIRILASVVNINSEIEVIVWVAMLTMFRALLRVSHVIKSPHTLLRKDISFHKWGVVICVRSAKNMRPSSSGVSIPIVLGSSESICPVRWLKYLVEKFPRPPDAPFFSSARWPFVTYYSFRKVFKFLCASADLSGNLASHSLRRGGASALAELGVPIADIKERGLWSSDCVHRYLSLSYARKRSVDRVFSSLF